MSSVGTMAHGNNNGEVKRSFYICDYEWICNVLLAISSTMLRYLFLPMVLLPLQFQI